MRTSGAQSEHYPLDVGVVQGSGLGPVMWNIFFTPIFDATKGIGIGFADDLNLITQDRMELDNVKASVIAACKDARITMEPSKETLTVFYPPRDAENTTEQPAIRLVGILVDPALKMEEHISLALKKQEQQKRS